MNQIIFIRGGEAFDSEDDFYKYLENREYYQYKKKKSWRDWIGWALSENFEVFEPHMPCKEYAKYKAWKIWFEKLFPYLKNNKIILVGSSLGGLFLVKYLSENNFPKDIFELHLVAPVFDKEGLIGEQVGDFELDIEKIESIEKSCNRIFLYFSTDDPILPFEHYYKYKKYFKKSKFFTFDDRGHFSQPSFPELLENINNGLKKC